MNSAWVKSQDRKRNLLAAGSTACVYIIAFLGAWLVGMIAPTTLASVPGMILVDLGGSEGPPGAIPQGLENAPDRPTGAPPGAAPLAAPAPVSGSAASASSVAALPEAAPKSATAKVAASKTPTAKAQIAKSVSGKASSEAKSAAETAKEAADAQAAAVADAAAQERVAQEESALRAAAATAAASGPPKTKTFGSSSSGRGGGAPVTSSGSGSSPGVAGGTGSVTFRGSEMGNSLSTTFGASSGSAGRNIYVPIYLYMPLPSRIDAATYRNIQTKETFRSYYQQSGADWTLKSQVPLSQRGEFWTMLEAAGYDASTADFKAGRELQPVTLEFAVGPQSKNRVELVDLRLITSSGSSEVDEAVIYGFRQASFFNKTGNAVGGKFVYGF